MPDSGGPPSAMLADELAPSKRAPGRITIFSLGAVLLGLFVVGAIIAQTHGGKVTKTTPEAITSTTSSGTGEKSGAGTTTTTSTTKTAGGTETTTTTVTPQEGVLLALLGTGAVLVLAGALYTRLTTIKLPGGAELGLSAAETQAVTDHVGTKVSANAEPVDVARAASTAVLLGDARKRQVGGPLGPEDLEEVADAAVKAIEPPPAPRSD